MKKELEELSKIENSYLRRIEENNEKMEENNEKIKDHEKIIKYLAKIIGGFGVWFLLISALDVLWFYLSSTNFFQSKIVIWGGYVLLEIVPFIIGYFLAKKVFGNVLK